MKAPHPAWVRDAAVTIQHLVRSHVDPDDEMGDDPAPDQERIEEIIVGSWERLGGGKR